MKVNTIDQIVIQIRHEKNHPNQVGIATKDMRAVHHLAVNISIVHDVAVQVVVAIEVVIQDKANPARAVTNAINTQEKTVIAEAIAIKVVVDLDHVLVLETLGNRILHVDVVSL